jgi:hypothetical protein
LAALDWFAQTVQTALAPVTPWVVVPLAHGRHRFQPCTLLEITVPSPQRRHGDAPSAAL